jgi:hypothetical protein
MRARVFLGRLFRRGRRRWLAHLAVALVCTWYFNHRTQLVPKWGAWYMGDIHPYVYFQVRAMLSGHLSLFRHPSGAANDYIWGRGGMHQPWGMGVPLLTIPFHIIGKWLGAPGFPDHLRFLILYAATAAILTRSLHRASRREEPTGFAASAAAAGFVMLFPVFVGLVAARFQIYEQTIAIGALWGVLLLAGLFTLLEKTTTLRLVVVGAAAGFAVMIRIPLAAYGFMTMGLALVIAHKQGQSRRGILAGIGAFAAVGALYLLFNALRFGSPFNSGYTNVVSGALVGRMVRWGLPFAKTPRWMAVKELFATLFLLDPVPSQIMLMPLPPAVAPYAIGERWREYYSPTFDLGILACWIASISILAVRVIRGRLWRRDRPLDHAAALAAWALPPSIVIFAFYSWSGTIVTRYAVDLFPAFAATALCVGTTIVDAVRARAPSKVGAAQILLAGVAALYLAGDRGWPQQLSHPLERQGVLDEIKDLDQRSTLLNRPPNHFACNEPRGPAVVHTHMQDWQGDCYFHSGGVFAMPRSPCVTFTFAGGAGPWGPADDHALAGFRATADFDPLVRCGGGARIDGDKRTLTVCEPHPPAFLLDGMRLYSLAQLDDDFNPIDRLKLERIDPAPACP